MAIDAISFHGRDRDVCHVFVQLQFKVGLAVICRNSRCFGYREAAGRSSAPGLCVKFCGTLNLLVELRLDQAVCTRLVRGKMKAERWLTFFLEGTELGLFRFELLAQTPDFSLSHSIPFIRLFPAQEIRRRKVIGREP